MLRIYKLILIGALVGLALLLPEVLARMFLPEWKPPASDKPSLFVHNPHTGWMHPAATTMDHNGGSIASNQSGLRDGEWGDKTRPRVLFLGDSFTWGWGIGQNGERYTDRLQEQFSDYQFTNVGIIGFNTLQEYLLLQHYFNDIKPDYLVLQIFANDFPENLTAEGIYPRPHFDFQDDFSIKNHPAPESNDGWIKKSIIYLGEHTYFYRQVIVRLFIFILDARLITEDKEQAPSEEDLLRGMEIALNLIFKFSEENHIPTIVIFSAMDDPQKKVIETTSKQYNVKSINLDPAFNSASAEWKDHTQHWNVYGHALVAEYLKLPMTEFINKTHE